MTKIHVMGPSWTTVIEVDRMYGDAASVASRCRSAGLAAKRKGDIVLVNAQADLASAR